MSVWSAYLWLIGKANIVVMGKDVEQDEQKSQRDFQWIGSATFLRALRGPGSATDCQAFFKKKLETNFGLISHFTAILLYP